MCEEYHQIQNRQLFSKPLSSILLSLTEFQDNQRPALHHPSSELFEPGS